MIKKLTQVERAELIGRLEQLRALGYAKPISGNGHNDWDEWTGTTADGVEVSLGQFSRTLLYYLGANPTPEHW